MFFLLVNDKIEESIGCFKYFIMIKKYLIIKKLKAFFLLL